MSTQTPAETRVPSDSDLPKEASSPTTRTFTQFLMGRPYRKQSDYYSKVHLSSVPLEERLAKQQKEVDEKTAVEMRQRIGEFNRREVIPAAPVDFREAPPGFPLGRPRQEPQSPTPVRTTHNIPQLTELANLPLWYIPPDALAGNLQRLDSSSRQDVVRQPQGPPTFFPPARPTAPFTEAAFANRHFPVCTALRSCTAPQAENKTSAVVNTHATAQTQPPIGRAPIPPLLPS